MRKADTDDSTPPDACGKTGLDPAAPQTVPAVTRAPDLIRSIGGGYEPPGVPVGYEDRWPPGFPGFVFLRDILNRRTYYAVFYDIPTECWPDGLEDRIIDQAIETLLATGAVRAAGIDPSTGEAVWAPRETWRLCRPYQGRWEYATWLALKGEPVRFPFQTRPFECEPFLPCRPMLLALGAETPPPNPPQLVLDSIWDWESWDQEAPHPEAKTAPDAHPITHTGYPGRPTSKPWIEAEFCRRRAGGETASTIAEEARILAAGHKAARPKDAQPTATTIEGHIRPLFRRPSK